MLVNSTIYGCLWVDLWVLTVVASWRLTVYAYVIHDHYVLLMTKPVTFRMDDEKLQVLDTLATAMDRDRSYLINEAVDNYLAVKQWHADEVKKAIAEADAGEFATDEEVCAAFDSFRNHP